jgi:hypothetical protein
MDESRTHDVPQISAEENEKLVVLFS